jgi:cephalosporin-C deacetylase
VFDIAYTSLDNVRISGWYCTPRRMDPPYPGLSIVPGYVSEPTLPKRWAKRGYATVGVAPRGKLRSNRQYNPGYPGLLTDNILDRNTYAYRGFYVDAVRAVDFLLERPEVDKTRIGVHGASQGGALTLTTAALRPKVVACGAAGAPYLCGFLDAARLTHSYPYEELNDYLRQFPDREPAMRATLNYFDVLNFAPLIRCPMLVYLGLEDDVCPPETGFALFDALVCEKTLHTYEGCSHEAGVYWESTNVETFLAEHLQRR